MPLYDSYYFNIQFLDEKNENELVIKLGII